MYSIDEILNGDIDEVQRDGDISIDEIQEVLENDNQDDDGEEVKKDTKDDDDDKVKKPKRHIHRVNLNAETLKGPRGLTCMENTFSKLKFSGKGYEQQDLDTVMNSLQHWCHRLFPKFTFDDTLEQIERLGTKKSVVVLRKKIIMNMMVDDPPPNQDDDDDAPVSQLAPVTPPPVDKFDSLFDRPPLKPKEPSPEIQITEEQLAIMERNRMLAAERRKARMAQLEEHKDKENLETSSNQIEAVIFDELEYKENDENLEPSSNQIVDKSIVSEVEEPMVE